MYNHDIMAGIVGALLVILLIGLVLRRFNQPHVIGYLIAGVILGPEVLGLVTNHETLSRMGDFGVMLLLFFIGLEVSLPRLISRWRLVVTSTIAQILISVGMMILVGRFAGWPFGRSILLGFIISLSSTAVVIKILEDWKEINTPIGQKVLGILLFQDIALIPMILILNFFSSTTGIDVQTMLLQTVGSILIICMLAWVMIKGKFNLPYAEKIRQDHELQIFVALVLCFGLAFITGMFGLSSALGAFVAGVVISFSQETSWVQHRLEPFKVVFVALFFVSIGMLVDLQFVWQNLIEILSIVILVFLINSSVMAVLFRLFRHDWRSAFYAGALLSQIGEFGFVLALTGKSMGFVSDYTYQLTLSIIAFTLLFSPLWINFVKRSRDLHVIKLYKVKASESAVHVSSKEHADDVE